MEMDNVNESKASSMFGNDTVSSFKECCFVCFYVVCFSVIKQTRFWNEETLDGIRLKIVNVEGR